MVNGKAGEASVEPTPPRHCERSEAIQAFFLSNRHFSLDCHVAALLAMTIEGEDPGIHGKGIQKNKDYLFKKLKKIFWGT